MGVVWCGGGEWEWCDGVVGKAMILWHKAL